MVLFKVFIVGITLKFKRKWIERKPSILICMIFHLLHLGSSPNFTSNIKQISANLLTSVPPEIIRKPLVFGWFQRGQNLIWWNSLNVRSEIWRRSHIYFVLFIYFRCKNMVKVTQSTFVSSLLTWEDFI